MSMLLVSNASMSDGPALNTLVENLAGATAKAKSPDAAANTACACVTLPKYPSRTSAGGAPAEAAEEADPRSQLLAPTSRATEASSASSDWRATFMASEG